MLSRLLLTLTLVLAACNTRPGPEVLAPDDGALPAGARIVQVLDHVRVLARAHKVDPALVEAIWTEMVEWFVAYEEHRL